jgi:FKBP-type peptidyl-prolyl cis-trans isomerase (trigger factor)
MWAMKILSQKREGNKVLLEIEEDYARFQESIETALGEAGKEIKIPGFRPGKAPREMVERVVNREVVENRAAQNLISEIYPQIIDSAKIDPVDFPNVEIVQQEEKKPFVFNLSVEVYPEVKLGKYKGVKIEKKPAKVTEEDVIKVLGRLQERFAVTTLDDEFAKKVSRYGTLAELKEEVRRALVNEKTAEAEADLRDKAIAAVMVETKVDIPFAMVEKEIGLMLDELKTSLAQSQLTLEDYLRGTKKEEKTLRDEMRKAAEVRVRGKIMLKAVAEAEKMSVSPEEMQAEIKAMADSMGEKPEELEKKLEEGSRQYIEDYLLRKKALDFIVEKAKIIE